MRFVADLDADISHKVRATNSFGYHTILGRILQAANPEKFPRLLRIFSPALPILGSSGQESVCCLGEQGILSIRTGARWVSRNIKFKRAPAARPLTFLFREAVKGPVFFWEEKWPAMKQAVFPKIISTTAWDRCPVPSWNGSRSPLWLYPLYMSRHTTYRRTKALLPVLCLVQEGR